MMATPALPEDQARLLSDALEAVRHQTGLMRKCLDMPGKLMDALKCWYVSSCPVRVATTPFPCRLCAISSRSPAPTASCYPVPDVLD